MTEGRSPAKATGKVRAARLTDLAALGELSRLCQSDDAETRSLGLPVSGPPIGVFSLFRLPLGAFRPHDLLYVYESGGRLSGLIRVERETPRDEWTVVELDAIGAADAGDIRFRLVQHLLREGAKRGAVRFHVACADVDGNVELFMQAGFARYGDEIILFRPADAPAQKPIPDTAAIADGIRPATHLDALALSRLYSTVTPQPVQRLEAVRLVDWERHGRDWRVPRSSLAPILRFADVEAFVKEDATGSNGNRFEGMVQVGVAKEDQPHYLKVLARPDCDPTPLIRYGLGVIAARAPGADAHRPNRGVIAAVRTYESPVDRRLEDLGFRSIATVTLLLKETLVRVAEPALVPAIGR